MRPEDRSGSKGRGAIKRRLFAIGVLIAAFGTPLAAGIATATPASADTVVGTCTIVSNPTSTNFTNCPGADLGGANLQGVDLSHANLAGAQFVDCAFGAGCSSADLSGANLTDANLAGASFSNSTLVLSCFPATPPCLHSVSGEASLLNATLTGANVSGTELVPGDVKLTATSTAGALGTWATPQSIPGATLGTCTPPSGSSFPMGTTTVTCQVLDDFGNVAAGTFVVTVVPIPTITNVSSPTGFSEVDHSATYTATVSSFSGTPTGGSVAFTDNGSAIAGCSAVPLSGAAAICSATPHTAGAHNIVASYSGSALFAASTSQDFTAAFTQVVTKTPCQTLAGCNLAGLDFTNARLDGSDLTKANLSGANLTNARLISVNLTNASLSGANLTNALLFPVDMTGANLDGANLTGVNLTSTTLTGTLLRGVIWSGTTCPDSTLSDNDGGTCIGHLVGG